MFNKKCDPEDFEKIENSLSYYEKQGHEEAIEVFRELKQKFEKECPAIVRQLGRRRTSTQPQPKKPQGFGRGFRGMIDAAFETENLSNQTPQKTRGFGRGFIGMIEEAFKEVERQAKAPVVIAKIPHGTIVDPLYGFPLICTKECSHTQCSSWGTNEMEGKLCRNRVPTNEEISRRHVKTSQIRTIFGGVER